MPSYDFEVDLVSLVKAAQAAGEVVAQKKDADVGDDVPGLDALGSDSLWSAVDQFQDRWERGVNDMTDDIEEVAGRLGKVAMTYAEFDQAAAQTLAAAAPALPGGPVAPDGSGPR